jgi:hypothetical protein
MKTCLYVDVEVVRRLNRIKRSIERETGRQLTWSDLLMHIVEIYECGSFCV